MRQASRTLSNQQKVQSYLLDNLSCFSLCRPVRCVRGSAIYCEMESSDQPHQKRVVLQSEDKPLSKRARKMLLKKQKFLEMKQQNKQIHTSAVGFGRECYAETEYYFENGLRKVYPYYYTFSTHVKGRWVGKTVLEIFSKEFCADTATNYQKLIEQGLLTVNGKKVSPDKRLRDNELLSHRLHRHENPVIGDPIQVIADTEDLVVINKPTSIPCHPCGRYRHNSIVFIVGKELGCQNLRNIYRLDRLTSGVLILGKTDSKTKELEKQIVDRKVTKEYVARVTGYFPDGEVTVDKPLKCATNKLGLWMVNAGGKDSSTTFKRLSYNGLSSVVLCVPHTGRTHQIRVHLQYLGHPILNDPYYNSEAFGPEKGKGGNYGGKSIDEVIKDLMTEHNPKLWEDGENPLFREHMARQAAEENIRSISGVGASLDISSLSGVETSPDISSLSGVGASPDISSASPRHCSPRLLTDGTLLESSGGVKATERKKRDEWGIVDGWATAVRPTCPGSLGIHSVGEDATVGSRPNTSLSENTAPVSSDLENEPPRKVQRLDPGQLTCERPSFQVSKWVPDPNCVACQTQYRDPRPSEMILYLHALSYAGPDWKYTAPLPDWAKDDWSE